MNQNISRILWILAAVTMSPVITSAGAAADHPLQLAMGNYNMGKKASGSGTTIY